MTIEKLMDLVFTEMVYRKIPQLIEEATLYKKDQTDGNQWTTEVTLKLCLICHVLFGFQFFPKLTVH